MAIQVTLSANQFNYSGTYNDHQYTSIQVESISNGRIYFSTIQNGMRMSRMPKQMKLVDGNVIISFGKNDKLVIGTYIDDTVQEETKEDTTNNTESLIDYSAEMKLCPDNFETVVSNNAKDDNIPFNIGGKVRINFTGRMSAFKDQLEDKDYTIVDISWSFADNDYFIGLDINGEKKYIVMSDLYAIVTPTKQPEEINSANPESLFTNVTPNKYTPNPIGYITHGNYAFQLSEGKDNHSINPNSKLYSVICINILTGEIDNTKCTCYDEGICQVIYLTKEAAIKDINSYSVQESIEPKQSRINLTKQPIPATNKPDQLTESYPQLNMIADYANIQYTGNKALITFTNANESNTVTFKYKRSWSARKYIDTAFNKTGIKPSWEFKYGWEYIS